MDKECDLLCSSNFIKKKKKVFGKAQLLENSQILGGSVQHRIVDYFHIMHEISHLVVLYFLIIVCFSPAVVYFLNRKKINDELQAKQVMVSSFL